MNNPNKPPSPNDTPPQRPRISLTWWLIMLALLAWNFWTLVPKGKQEIAIPYTAFVDQIQAGNVTEVQISGAEISGTFKSGVPATDLVPPDQVPSASTTPQTSSTPTLYTSFTTTFPEAVGDPNLIPLLEANNVILNAQTPASPVLLDLLSSALPFILLIFSDS